MNNMRGTTWVMIVYLVFLSLLSTALILSLAIFTLVRLDIMDGALRLTGLPVLVFAAISITVGTVMAAVFGQMIGSPIKKLSEAMKKVSKGDFTVQVENEDLNEIGELTRDFNRMVRDLGSIETLRNDFVTNVSHEFKTPIASIEGCAGLLQTQDLTEEEREEYTRMIAESAHRLSLLTTNILKLSKLENQEIVAEQTKFRLDEQIRMAILMLEPQWSAKNIEFDIELEEAEIFSGEELLMQVWLNIIGNAIKFSGSDGRVSVSMSDNGYDITVCIADGGVGMTPEVQEHIFDKFYQGDKSHAAYGNGLGLALVKRILDLFGGRIEVESILGEGSVFTVTLLKN